MLEKRATEFAARPEGIGITKQIAAGLLGLPW
jgi:hypothetical protein